MKLLLSLLIVLLSGMANSSIHAQMRNVSTQESGAISAPDLAVGDWWMFRTASGQTWKTTIKEITLAGEVIFVDERHGREYTYTKELNRVQGYNRNGQVQYDAPHNRNYDWPLFPGKAWEGWSRWRSGGWEDGYYVKGTAAEWEEISLGLQDGERTVSAIRIDYVHVNRGRETHSSAWYSPDVRFMIKFIPENPAGSYWLVGYGRANGS